MLHPRTKMRLGRYDLVAEIAQGGMGVVYLASASSGAGVNKLLVVKELKPELAEDEMHLRMFQAEARIATRLSHHNIVQTFEVGADGDRHYLVMEHLEGESLVNIQRRLKKQKMDLPARFSLSVMAEVLEALEYAHGLTDFDGTALKLIHRDVSPHNVFVTYDGRVKLLDFGIAKGATSDTTRAGLFKGRIAYVPAEQLAQEKLDARADLYSAGVVLWECIAERRMWAKRTEDEIVHAILNGGVPRIRDVLPDVPDSIAELLGRATEASAEARFGSAREFREAIDAYLTTLGGPMHPREVGALVSSLFAEDREYFQALIQEHIKKLRDPKRVGSGTVSMLQLPAAPDSLPTVTKAGQDEHTRRLPAASFTPLPRPTFTPGPSPTPSLTPTPTPTPTAGTLGGAAASFVPSSPSHAMAQPSSRSLLTFAGAAALLVGLVGLSWVSVRTLLDGREAPSAPSASALGSAPAAVLAPAVPTPASANDAATDVPPTTSVPPSATARPTARPTGPRPVTAPRKRRPGEEPDLGY